MSAATAPCTRIATGPLTEQGLVVVLTYRLRVAMEQVNDQTQDAILAGLPKLVEAHCPSMVRASPGGLTHEGLRPNDWNRRPGVG
jgi:hypothetical protein